MLEIIDDIQPFIEDNYRRINVREYARIRGISPPTASKTLFRLHREGLLKKEIDRQYIYFYAHKESSSFIDLSRIYWRVSLESAGLVSFLEEEFLHPVVVLFGSLSKAETKEDSDIDLAVFAATKKEIPLGQYEKKLKRRIQLMLFKNRDDVKSTELLNNILNGYIITGSW